MQVNGIIAEYNPFHNGHTYQLNMAKQQTDADYTIIAMSGNFVQRGTPALLDKYIRAQMALQNGADLVLELPSCYSCSSAEYFATGAVALLDRLGVVNHLCFGSECGETGILIRIATLLNEEPPIYVNTLKRCLKEGCSYPVARTMALIQCDPSLGDFHDVLSSPNNILGIEYIRALLRRKSTILPVTTRRAGSDYHDIRLGLHQSSAKAIRQAIYEEKEIDCLREHMPENAFDLMSGVVNHTRPLHPNDISSVLHYKLLYEHNKGNGYTRFLDVSQELSDRISKNLLNFQDFESFASLLKTKDMTYTRISRCLLHILLDIETKEVHSYTQFDYIPYARVLGFRKESAALLTAIKANSSIPLITKLADAEQILDAPAYAMLDRELRINEIYQSIAALRTKTPMVSEFSRPIVIM